MSNENAMKPFNTRLTEADLEQLERLRQQLQERMGPKVKVSYRIVIEEAMERLQAHLDKLDRDKGRNR